MSHQPSSEILVRLIEIMERSKARKLELRPRKKIVPAKIVSRPLGRFAT